MIRLFFAVAAGLLFPFLSGCTAFTLPRPGTQVGLDLNAPAFWESAQTTNVGPVTTGWLETFGDPEVERLVDEALRNNWNLGAAAARLRAAKEGAIIGRSVRLPSVNASSSGVRLRSDRRSESPEYTTDYGLRLNASWEVDLWGRLRDLDAASRANYEAAAADFRGARLSLAANTAKAWYNLITANQQVAVAQQTRDSFATNFGIIERMYKEGVDTASALDVQFTANNVASAERSLIDRRLAREEAARTLELLLGRYPSAELEARDNLPSLSKDVPAGLPAALLSRRPDLLAAASGVWASAKLADAARKNLLPSLVLSGGGSTASDALGRLLADPEVIVLNAAAFLAQSVYEGGALNARARQALAQNEAVIRDFAALALQAFREVESALATEESLAAQEGFLATELRQANLAESQAARDFSEGLVGILEILEAQRRGVNARNAMILLRSARIQNRVDLHLALGGDFETLPPSSAVEAADQAR